MNKYLSSKKLQNVTLGADLIKQTRLYIKIRDFCEKNEIAWTPVVEEATANIARNHFYVRKLANQIGNQFMVEHIDVKTGIITEKPNALLSYIKIHQNLLQQALKDFYIITNKLNKSDFKTKKLSINQKEKKELDEFIKHKQ